MKKVCILGLGYIGLPTALKLAEYKYKVLGIDIKQDHIKKIQKGLLDFKEEDLNKLFKKIILQDNFKVSIKPEESDIYIIAVPTPFLKKIEEYPKPDISFVIAAIKSITNLLKKGDLVIIESTCPVGTTEKLEKVIFQLSGLNRKEVNIAYCPERVLPGNTLHELINNNRIIGGLTNIASQKALTFI